MASLRTYNGLCVYEKPTYIHILVPFLVITDLRSSLEKIDLSWCSSKKFFTIEILNQLKIIALLSAL